MVEFSNREELERWLNEKPHEWSVVIAARATLRVAPMLATAFGWRGVARKLARNTVLISIRGMATPWFAAMWPYHIAEIATFLDSATRAAGSVETKVGPTASFVALAAASAGYAAVEKNAAVNAAYAGVDAAQSVESFNSVHVSDIWGAISADAAELESRNGLSPASLANQALWRTGTPIWANENWKKLEAALRRADEHWDVWTDWYEARLRGSPANEQLELARVMIADEIWEQGPKVVNAHIKELIQRHNRPPDIDSIPRQVSDALLFGGADDVPIGQIDPPGDGVSDTKDQRQGHSDIREKAGQLETFCGQNNRLAILKGHAAKLLLAAGETLLDLHVRAFWSQMNSLRRRHEADIRARSQNDPDTPPLPEDIAGVLQDLVETLNVFSAHEAKLSALDDVARDPSERVANERTVQAARDIAEAAPGSPQTIDRDAASSLADVATEAVGDTPSAERSKEFTTKSARNLALELLRRAYKGALGETGFAWKSARDGAYKLGGGAGVSYGAAVFIKANEAAVRTLIDTLGGSSTLQHIVDLIIKILS